MQFKRIDEEIINGKVVKILPGLNGNAYSASRVLWYNIKKQNSVIILSNPVDSEILCKFLNSKINDYTIGNYLDGRYTADSGITFGENSLSVSIIGINSKTLINIATEMCDEFMQETVLVKDFTTGNIYLVDNKKEEVKDEN